jgi:transposase
VPVEDALAILQAENAALRAQLAERDAALDVATAQIEALSFNLAVLRRRQFGQSSERLAAEIDQLELRLEDLEESRSEQSAARAPTEPTGASAAKARKPAIRKPLPPHLPRETVMHEPEIICTCGDCDRSKLTRLGEDVTEVLEKIPARLKVIRHVRPRYACRKCEAVFQAPAPDLPIERGRPGPGLIANILVGKFCDGLPLYRQSVILAREGIDIDRATLADWLGHAAWWLAPLAALIGQYVMGLPVIHTDDTTIKVLAPGNGKTRTGRFWVYAADPRIWAGTGPPAAFYRYSPDRDGERPRTHLAGFSGFLHADAYAGYGALYRSSGQLAPRVTHVACFAHARRKFFEVWEATKSPIAEEAVRRIAKLYEIEAEIAGRAADVRLAARHARSQPLLDEFHAWANAQRRRVSGKTALGRAFNYALNRWEALSCFALDGRLSIDNNLSERLLRGVAITRKNFMFVGSDRGGDRAAVFYTLIETAKLNGLDPEAYIAAIVHRMASGHGSRKLDALLPWNFKSEEAKAA